MTPGKKLALGVALVTGVTVYMAYVGATSSWQYYLTADEAVAQLGKLDGRRLRVSGGVAQGTLRIDANRSRAEFQLAGREGQLAVVCDGRLPDNLAEGTEVVVEGRLETGGVLRGDKVLTRCASKYETEGAADGASEGAVTRTADSRGAADAFAGPGRKR